MGCVLLRGHGGIGVMLAFKKYSKMHIDLEILINNLGKIGLPIQRSPILTTCKPSVGQTSRVKLFDGSDPMMLVYSSPKIERHDPICRLIRPQRRACL